MLFLLQAFFSGGIINGKRGYHHRNLHDYVYLNPAEDGFELYEGVQNHIAYYNEKTHHTTRQSPNNRYNETIKKAA